MLFTILMVTIPLSVHSIYRSVMNLSSYGYEFQTRYSVQLLSETITTTRSRCYAACNQQPFCHAFDYDSSSSRCRLFEGDRTTGAIISSHSAFSIVGTVHLSPSLFAQIYGQSCQACQEDRYQFCSTATNTCQCRPHTFWNGVICALQFFSDDSCSQNDSCRSDLNLVCATDGSGNLNKCLANGTSNTIVNNIQALAATCSASAFPGRVLRNFNVQSLSKNFRDYTYNFTAASSPISTLMFPFSTPHNNGWYIDNVSVRNAQFINSTELVTNGDFATGNLFGWTQLCSMNCSKKATQNVSGVTTKGCRKDSVKPCYYGSCDPPTYVYLLQSFTTNSGSVYQLRFSMKIDKNAHKEKMNMVVFIA